MCKVILKGHIIVSRQELSAIRQQLPIHIELSQKEVGCLTFNVEVDSNNECKFYVYEEFIDKESFEHHQTRIQSSDWGK